jgi:hypothetical protein
MIKACQYGYCCETGDPQQGCIHKTQGKWSHWWLRNPSCSQLGVYAVMIAGDAVELCDGRGSLVQCEVAATSKASAMVGNIGACYPMKPLAAK